MNVSCLLVYDARVVTRTFLIVRSGIFVSFSYLAFCLCVVESSLNVTSCEQVLNFSYYVMTKV